MGYLNELRDATDKEEIEMRILAKISNQAEETEIRLTRNLSEPEWIRDVNRCIDEINERCKNIVRVEE